MNGFPAYLVACAVVLGAFLSSAQAHPLVEKGKQQMERGDFRKALQTLEDAEHLPDLTDEDLVDVYWHQGLILHSMGKEKAAIDAFDKLVELQPLYLPPRRDTPPEVRALFESRAVQFQREKGVRACVSLLRGATMEVRFTGNVASVTRVVLYVRPSGERAFVRFDAAVQGGVALVDVKEPALWERMENGFDVVVEAYARRNTVLSREGDALAPLTVGITPQARDLALRALRDPPVTTEITPPVAPAPANPEPVPSAKVEPEGTAAKSPSQPPVARADDGKHEEQLEAASGPDPKTRLTAGAASFAAFCVPWSVCTGLLFLPVLGAAGIFSAAPAYALAVVVCNAPLGMCALGASACLGGVVGWLVGALAGSRRIPLLQVMGAAFAGFHGAVLGGAGLIIVASLLVAGGVWAFTSVPGLFDGATRTQSPELVSAATYGVSIPLVVIGGLAFIAAHGVLLGGSIGTAVLVGSLADSLGRKRVDGEGALHVDAVSVPAAE